MPTSVELREERAGLVQKAREIQTKADAEKRDFSSEETQEFERVMAEVDSFKSRIDRIEKLEAAESDLSQTVERRGVRIAEEPQGAREPEDRDDDGPRRKGSHEKRVRAAVRHWMMTGETPEILRGEEQRAGKVLAEHRDTIISTDAKGGYLITPTVVSDDIVQLTNDLVFMYNLATVTKVTEAKKLGIRKRSTRMADANWTTEVAAVTEDTTGAYGRRDLEPYLLSKLAKVSLRTLLLSADAENEITNELAYKFSITKEKAFLTGTGSSQPLGIFTADANGISTARDVTASAATSFSADDLINLKFSLKQAYLADPNAGFVLHRDAVKMARKLKDSQNQYLWQPGLQSGAPDRILDLPYYMSEYAPNTFTTGLYVIVCGNFRYYRIAEVIDVMLQRLVELYAGTNEVGFIGRCWFDGAPIVEEAFSRLKLA